MGKIVITPKGYIFKYTDLTYIEQILLLEQQVRELQKIIKNKNIEIEILKEQIKNT